MAAIQLTANLLRHIGAGLPRLLHDAEWERLQRGVAEFEITLATGRPKLYPEQPTTVRGFKPQIDEANWVLTKVSHSLTNSGYTNNISLEVAIEDLPEVEE